MSGTKLVTIWAFAGTLFALMPTASAEVPIKVPLAPGATPLSELGRYKVTRGFDDLVEYYKRQFKSEPGVRWYSIINQPGLRAKHLASLRKNTEWEGINIYERGNEVRLYVVPRGKRPVTSKSTKPAPATKSAR
ncbi:MAG: hypothetical protein H7Z43_11195 [Clostridia bacterium]|nr:hypothetical protein [Deltaproteobacteria bacterium]